MMHETLKSAVSDGIIRLKGSLFKLVYKSGSFFARIYRGKNLKITFYDRYDFETQAWEDSITIGSIVKILNNYAAYAQEVGAIVPYDIKVTVEKSF